MKSICIVLCATIWIFFSCDQENIGTFYETESPYVAFSSPVVSGNVLSAENNFSVVVQVVRSELAATATATVSLEMNENIDGIFDLESNIVTFEEGEAVAYVKIIPVVEPSLIDPTKNYIFNLTLTGDHVSTLYNKTSYRASFKYTPAGTGILNSAFFEDEWPVDIEMLEVGNLILYRVKSMYDSDYDITIKVLETDISVNVQAGWSSDEYGDVYIEGTGTRDGKVLNMLIEHFIPDVGSYGEYNEIVTLP